MDRLFALVLLSFWVSAFALDLVVIHTNDMHSRIDEISRNAGTCKKNCYGGFARVKKEADRIRRENRNVLFLNAGDTFQGTPFYTIHKWKVIAPFVDELRIDAMSLGNHEFDDGVPGLVPYLQTVKTPVVTCNINTSQEVLWPTKGINLSPWINFTIEGKVIGVIGYLTPETKFLAQIGNVILLDEVESIRETARKAKAAGAHIIIAIGHSGFDIDQKIAMEVEEVDFVVGGHTNTFLYTGPPPDIEVPAGDYPFMITQKSGKKVPVVQAFAFTKYLGYIELKFDDNNKLISSKGNPILLDSTYPKDEALELKIKPWREKVKEASQAPVSITRVDLDGNCRWQECNLGNAITDSWVNYVVRTNMPPEGWTIAPISIINGGAIRASITKNDTQDGKLTGGNVLVAMPFRDQVFMITLNGSVLLEALELSVKQYDPNGVIQRGAFLQFSGLRVVYDISQPPGKRVHSALARCGDCLVPKYEPIMSDKNYTVILSEFLSEGGDDFTMFKNYPRINVGEVDSEIFSQYLNRTYPVYQGIEGRITFLGKDGNANVSPPSPRQANDAVTKETNAILLLVSYLLSKMLH